MRGKGRGMQHGHSVADAPTHERVHVILRAGCALRDVLKHPLALLAAAAVVSGLLVPSFTRQWQISEKELELKAELVGDISQDTTDFLIAIQSSEVLARGRITGRRLDKAFDELNAAYFRFETRSALIDSRLDAYFADEELNFQWTVLAEALKRFYTYQALRDSEQRNDAAADLLVELKSVPLPTGMSNVVPKEPRLPRDIVLSIEVLTSGGPWARVKGQLLARRDAVIQTVLHADSAFRDDERWGLF